MGAIMRRQRPRFKEWMQLGAVAVVAIFSVGLAIVLNGGSADQRGSGQAQLLSGAAASATQSTEGISATPGASPAIGAVIPLPSSNYGELTLISTGTPPSITSAEAIDIVRRSVTAPLTDQITSTFGLATFGQRGADGRWVGDQNVRLPDGEIVDHIENRPMWIVDVGGLEGAVGGQTTRQYNHVVFAVDTMTRGVVLVWSYPGD